MSSEKFDQLEAKIKSVVDTCLRLKQRVTEQEEELRAKNQELRETAETMRILTEERDTVRSKVESLIEKLDALDVP